MQSYLLALMPPFLIALGAIGVVVSVWLSIVTHDAADEYFRKVVARHPELEKSFPEPGFGVQYGPIRPSYMEFLKKKRHLLLPEVELQREGSRVLAHLYSHAITFTVSILLFILQCFLRSA
jgi:hypothetical protein